MDVITSFCTEYLRLFNNFLINSMNFLYKSIENYDFGFIVGFNDGYQKGISEFKKSNSNSLYNGPYI